MLTFIDIQPIKDDVKYTKEVDLKTGKVTVVKEPEKKLEPGCDKCEISECKFLEDPFMNPPYNVLWDKWKAQKETIKKLMSDKKEMQDSIDFLEDDKKSLQDLIRQLREEKQQLKDALEKEDKKKFKNNTGEELNIPEFIEKPADEEIHSCDDCEFKDYGPYSAPCKDCDLHQNPPSEWMP